MAQVQHHAVIPFTQNSNILFIYGSKMPPRHAVTF